MSKMFSKMPIAPFPVNLFTDTLYLCHKQKGPWLCFVCRNHNTVFPSFMTYHQVFGKSNMTDATTGARIAYPSEAPEINPVFLVGFMLLNL